MVQIKTFKPEDGEDAVNAFLAKIKTENVRHVDVKESGFTVILYEAEQTWTNRLCCDCKYFDDGGDPSSIGGVCIECGSRRRFNCKACEHFKDVRD